MVEIVHRGRLPGERVHQCVCTNCKSTLRFQEKEATNVTSYQDTHTILQIICPVCNREVYHYPDRVRSCFSQWADR